MQDLPTSPASKGSYAMPCIRVPGSNVRGFEQKAINNGLRCYRPPTCRENSIIPCVRIA